MAETTKSSSGGPGGHATDRNLTTGIRVSSPGENGSPTTDDHIKNLVQRIREQLQINQPVMAYRYTNMLRDYLLEKGIIDV